MTVTAVRANRLLTHEAARREADSIVRELRAVQPAAVKRMEGTILPLLAELGERVSRRALPMLSDPRFMEAKWRPNLNKADVQRLIEDILAASSLREWAGGTLTDRFWEHHAWVLQQTARVLIRAGLASNTTQARINQLLANGGRRAGLVDITGDTRKALFRAIQQAAEDGLGPRETARLIRDFVPEGRFVNAGASYRASLIARTETLHAQRTAALDRYRSNQIRMVVAYDGDHDATCLMRNGQEYTLTDAEDEMLNTHPQCVLAFGPLAGV